MGSLTDIAGAMRIRTFCRTAVLGTILAQSILLSEAAAQTPEPQDNWPRNIESRVGRLVGTRVYLETNLLTKSEIMQCKGKARGASEANAQKIYEATREADETFVALEKYMTEDEIKKNNAAVSNVVNACFGVLALTTSAAPAGSRNSPSIARNDKADAYRGLLEQAITSDAKYWSWNTLDSNSFSGFEIVDESSGSEVIVYGNYTYNGGVKGYARARISNGSLICIEFHDYPGTCRGPR